MKIGILTFHRAHNYGAMLQAYALQRVLTCKGHEVEFISYRQSKIEEAYRAWIWQYDKSASFRKNVINFISSILTLFRRQKRRKAFLKFAVKKLPESRAYTQEQMLNQPLDYDLVFFGSDQIWTTRFLGTFDSVLWGDINLKKGKKIAYAPSMELKHVSNEQKEYIKGHLENFDYVSARETHMAQLLETITGKVVPIVLDPTLLCKRTEFSELIASSCRVPSKPYVLVYQIGNHKIVMDVAKVVAAQLGCGIIEIGSKVLLHSHKSYIESCDPADFVSLIANATFVVSCSFHGTAFSINFNKPFYSILISGADSRVQSLLCQTNLQKCGIRGTDEVDVQSIMDIDYSKVECLLEELRNTSMSYIDQAIN